VIAGTSDSVVIFDSVHLQIIIIIIITVPPLLLLLYIYFCLPL